MPSPAELMAARKAKRKPKAACQTVRNYPWKCLVRQYRTKNNLTSKEVAKAVGLSASGYFELENGQDPMLSTAKRIAAFFGVKVEVLWPQWKGV